MSELFFKPAHEFEAPAILADNTLQEEFSLAKTAGKYRVLFFYPEDFSTVCPTELMALDQTLSEFQQRDCLVLGISVDPPETHRAWKETAVEEGGIGPVGYPLISDATKEISRAYGILLDDAVSLRGTFILDREGTIRHATINGPDLGRSVPEILRTLDAIRHIDETGQLCPVNWGVEEEPKKRRPPTPAPAGIKKRVQDFDLP